MRLLRQTMPVLFLLGLFVLSGCREALNDVQSMLMPRFTRSEIFGFVAGFGTTFAGLPDLIAMLRRRSRAGMRPNMAALSGAFQVLWIYYGLLIGSRPVVAWNTLAVLINSLIVGAWAYFGRRERQTPVT